MPDGEQNKKEKAEYELIWRNKNTLGRLIKLQELSSTYKIRPFLEISGEDLVKETEDEHKTSKTDKKKKSHYKERALLDYLHKDEKREKRNHLIYGDSFNVISILLKRGLKEQVQMVYFDPPFGIDFQGKVSSQGKEIKAYSDRWNEGFPSFLNYIQKNLFLIHQLLTPEGSLFLQIGEDNLHYVRVIVDEIFGKENFISQITFRTAISTNKIDNIADYLLWYAKDKNRVFRRELFTIRNRENIEKTFTYKETKEECNDPSRRKDDQNAGVRKFKPQEIVKRISHGMKRLPRCFEVEFKGKKYVPPKGYEWKWNKEEIETLIKKNRIVAINNKLYGKRYLEDFPYMILTNIWMDTSTSTFASLKNYSVHTNPKVIRRCIAMTTRPGDLVLDPTSGSGTTAFVAEELERQWIVIDNTILAISATLGRVLLTSYPQYKKNSQGEFDYQQFEKISISKLAKNKESVIINIYDCPIKETRKNRKCKDLILWTETHTLLEIINMNKEKREKEETCIKFLNSKGKVSSFILKEEFISKGNYLRIFFATENVTEKKVIVSTYPESYNKETNIEKTVNLLIETISLKEKEPQKFQDVYMIFPGYSYYLLQDLFDLLQYNEDRETPKIHILFPNIESFNKENRKSKEYHYIEALQFIIREGKLSFLHLEKEEQERYNKIKQIFWMDFNMDTYSQKRVIKKEREEFFLEKEKTKDFRANFVSLPYYSNLLSRKKSLQYNLENLQDVIIKSENDKNMLYLGWDLEGRILIGKNITKESV